MVSISRERRTTTPQKAEDAAPATATSVDRGARADRFEGASVTSGRVLPSASASGNAVGARPVARGLSGGEARAISAGNQRLVDALANPHLSAAARDDTRAALMRSLERGDVGVADALHQRALAPVRKGADWAGGFPEQVLRDAAAKGVASARAPYAQLEAERALAMDTTVRRADGAVDPAASERTRAKRDDKLAALLAGAEGDAVRTLLGARTDLASLGALSRAGTAADLDAIVRRVGDESTGALAAQALRDAGDEGVRATARALNGANGANGAHRASPSDRAEHARRDDRLRELLLSPTTRGALERGDPEITRAVVDAALQPSAIVPSHVFDALAAGKSDAALAGLARIASSAHAGGSAGFALAKLGARGRDAALAAWSDADALGKTNLLRALAPAFANDPRAERALLEGAASADPALSRAALEHIERTMAGAAGRDEARRTRVTTALADAERAGERAMSARADRAHEPDGTAHIRRALVAALTHADTDERTRAYADLRARGLDDTAAAVARTVGASADHRALEDLVRSGDVTALARATDGDLALLDATVGAPALHAAIDATRARDPAAADRTLDALFTATGANGKPLARHDAFARAQLTRDAEKNGDVVARFAARHVVAGETADAYTTYDRAAFVKRETSARAIDALAATKSEAGAAALIDRAALANPRERDAMFAALARHGPREAVDRAALTRLGATDGARARADAGDPRAAAAARALLVAGTPEARAIAGAWRTEQLRTRNEALDAQKKRTAKELETLMHDVPVLKWLAAEGVNQTDKLRTDIATKEARVKQILDEREDLARDVTAILSDDGARANIADDARGADALARAADALESTEEGREWVEKHLAPALQQSVIKDPLFAQLLHPAKDEHRQRAVVAVTKMALPLAAAGAATYTVALAHALKLDGRGAKDLAQLLELKAQDAVKPGAAKVPGALAKAWASAQLPLTIIDRAVSVGGAALSIRRAFEEQSPGAVVGAARDTFAAIKSFAGNTTRAFVVLNLLTAPIDAYTGTRGAFDAYGRGDTADGVGQTAKGLGGVLTLAGAIATATVGGAVAGVPLMVIGGIVTGVGSVISLVFGDSAHEKVARELGYM